MLALAWHLSFVILADRLIDFGVYGRPVLWNPLIRLVLQLHLCFFHACQKQATQSPIPSPLGKRLRTALQKAVRFRLIASFFPPFIGGWLVCTVVFYSCCMGSRCLKRQVGFYGRYVVFLCSKVASLCRKYRGCMCEVKGLCWPLFCRFVLVLAVFQAKLFIK